MRAMTARSRRAERACPGPAGRSPAWNDHVGSPMSRRKYVITARMNERDCPHIVELALPPGGFRARSDAMLAFHRERHIQIRRGLGRNDDGQFYVRYCFADPAHADAFRDRFGGERLTATLDRSNPRASAC